MKKKKINIFQLKFENSFRKKLNKGVDKILDEGFLSNHTFVKKFEDKFKKYNKSKYCVAVNSGTSALELIFRSINVQNKKVLIASNTFVATAIAAKSAGGIPIPVDIDKEFRGFCEKDLLKKIDKTVGAIVIVHIGGLISSSLLKIVKICKSKKIPLVEDCAQAFASTFKKKFVGNFGLAGAFSFQTTKVLTSGEGGLVVTNNMNFYKKLYSNRFYGFDYKNKLNYNSWGNNFKMSEFVALCALCDFDRVKKRILKRILLAKIYQRQLKNSGWLALKPKNNEFTAYYKQIVISPISRTIVEKEFKKYGINLTGGVYYRTLHRQTILGLYNDDEFPNASFFADNHICPPCYPELKASDITYITNVLKKISKINLEK
jgi:dTDP-4-amino-4,6-dideoxygalactose transaminase